MIIISISSSIIALRSYVVHCVGDPIYCLLSLSTTNYCCPHYYELATAIWRYYSRRRNTKVVPHRQIRPCKSALVDPIQLDLIVWALVYDSTATRTKVIAAALPLL